MSIVTGSEGLIGSESVARFAEAGYDMIGLENDMRTVCVRGGCLTGPNHAGTNRHGFLSYNIAGGGASNCSMLEAITMCEEIAGPELDWAITYDIRDVLGEIHEQNADLWAAAR